MKKRLAALTALAILLFCLSACRATEQEGFEPEAEKHRSNSSAYIAEPKGEDETVVSQTDPALPGSPIIPTPSISFRFLF